MTKRCAKCGATKPVSEFHTLTRRGRFEFKARCRDCVNEYRRGQYEPHPRRRQIVPGERFGRLTVAAEAPSAPGARMVTCTCDCGTEKTVRLAMLVRGDTQSCGCLHREQMAERNRAVPPGPSSHWLWSTWSGMMARCYNANHRGYKNYGGRGISVCEPWHDVRVFIADIEQQLGMRPDGTTMDRIDNDGNYEPGNVRWATRSEQRRNRRTA